jgi:hypothetical protein
MMAAMYSFENRDGYELRKANVRERIYLGENDEEQEGEYDELKRLGIELE